MKTGEDVQTIIIIAGAATIAYFAYRFFLKKSSESKPTIVSTNTENSSNAESKRKIRQEIINLKDKYLENLINFEITFLVQTELDDTSLEEEIYTNYPKTLGRDSLIVSSLYPTYGASLVQKCTLEYLHELGIQVADMENKQPSEKLDDITIVESKTKARKIFDEYLLNNSKK